MAPGRREIPRLPEELVLEAILSILLTTPLGAARAAAVSLGFRTAADSDAVWSRFLPRDLPPLATGELDPAPPTKKALYLRLSDSPLLLADRLMSMWLDRETGAKCYILSARALHIVWGSTPRYWKWIPLAKTDSRFAEAARLQDVCWLEIHGTIHSKMLSQNKTYAAYMVFKTANRSYGLDYPLQEASVSIGERNSTRQICIRQRKRRVRPLGDNVVLPQERADGWMELEMGEFHNEEGDDGEVSISLMEIKGGNWKKGLIVQGIEIRAKK